MPGHLGERIFLKLFPYLDTEVFWSSGAMFDSSSAGIQFPVQSLHEPILNEFFKSLHSHGFHISIAGDEQGVRDLR